MYCGKSVVKDGIDNKVNGKGKETLSFFSFLIICFSMFLSIVQRKTARETTKSVIFGRMVEVRLTVTTDKYFFNAN